MPTMTSRLAKIEGRTNSAQRIITVEAPDDFDDAAIDTILADHGVVPGRSDLIVHLRRFDENYDRMASRVAVDTVEQTRVAAPH